MEKEQTQFTCHNYKDATKVKFKNRRVIVEDIDNNDVGICFKIVCSKEDAVVPSASHRTLRDKIKITCIRISEDAAIALYHALGRRLSNRKMPEQ